MYHRQAIKATIANIKQNRLFKDSFWALTGNVMNKGLSLLAGIIVARFLGANEYGEYGMIKNTLIYIAVFSTFGLGFSVTKFIAQYKKQNPDKLYILSQAANIISLGFSGIMAVFVFIFSSQIAIFLNAPEISLILKYTAATIVFNSLATVQIGTLAGLKAFKQTALINGIVGVATFIASVVGTYYYGLDGAVLALLITNILNCVLNYILISRIISPTKIESDILWKEIKALISFSTPIAFQESTVSITYWLGTLILVKCSTYTQMGLYAVAAQWGGVVMFIPGVLQNVLLSHLSTVAIDENADKNKTLHRMLLINFLATFVPFLLILILSPIIIHLYGASYNGLAIVLNIQVGATIFQCFVQVYVQEYIAIGRTWTLSIIRMGRDIFNIGMAWIFISLYPQHGATILVSCYALGALICLISLITLHKPYNQEPNHINSDDNPNSI